MKLKYLGIFIICLCTVITTGCKNKCSNNHEHVFVEGKCECGEIDANYQPPHTHNYVEGVCPCGQKDPNYVTHVHNYVEGKCECGALEKEREDKMKQLARKGFKWVLTEKGYNATKEHIKHEREIGKPVFPNLGYDET